MSQDAHLPPGHEWKTATELGKILGVGRSQTLQRIRKARENGKVETRIFYSLRSDGQRMPINHYRLIK